MPSEAHHYARREAGTWGYPGSDENVAFGEKPSGVRLYPRRELVLDGWWQYCTRCGCSEGMILHMGWSSCPP